jgi:hypothetical protein
LAFFCDLLRCGGVGGSPLMRWGCWVGERWGMQLTSKRNIHYIPNWTTSLSSRRRADQSYQ